MHLFSLNSKIHKNVAINKSREKLEMIPKRHLCFFVLLLKKNDNDQLVFNGKEWGAL